MRASVLACCHDEVACCLYEVSPCDAGKPQPRTTSPTRIPSAIGCLIAVALGLLLTLASASQGNAKEAASDEDTQPSEPAGESAISYDRDVMPIFRRACFGCHQSGKRQGDYLMTEFAALLGGGESEQAAIVPGDPNASYLIDQITPRDGHAEMPQAPWPGLSELEIETIRRWIAEGAANDAPEQRASYDADQPPVYQNAPVITSLDVSHDGRLIAAAAYHEVILIDATSGDMLARLVGLSPRVNSVRFSPDSTRLAAAAGTPAQSGELQIWDVASRQLHLSVPVGSDTLSGVRWSPDGSQLSFGSVNTVRAIDTETGEQLLFQGAHEDWVLDTIYTVDGAHLVSVARDMTCKLTEVATQRFIDNVTSITPGALSGGLNALDRHPQRNEILVGGADGIAKVYRVFRETARKIGDDANLIRALPALKGRIFSVAVSPDGTRLAAAATIDGGSEIRVWQYDFDGTLSEEIKKLSSKRINELTAEEKATLQAHRESEATEVWRTELDQTSIYAIRFAPDNSLVASGSSGQLQRFDPAGGLLDPYGIVAISDLAMDSPTAPPFDAAQWSESVAKAVEDRAAEPAVDFDAVVKIEAIPSAISLDHPLAYNQVVVTATLADGSVVDVTRWCDALPSDVVAANSRMLVRPLADGQGELIIRLGKQITKLPVIVTGIDNPSAVDFIRDVNPVLSRLGCNGGSCHGAQAGKNGFKLSLRGYDPIFDIRSLTDDHAARRINPASPDESLMLSKPLGFSPHQGGTLMTPGDPYHNVLRDWIASGSKLDLATPRVTRIEVTPTDPVVTQIGSRQQVRVVAHYGDDRWRDVTHEAFVTSGNTEVADVDAAGLLTTIRRGEASILARYEGAYAATTLTVMGQREGFEWKQPPTFNRIDDLVAKKWERMRILPSELCSDEEFLRRVYLDLSGLPPTSDEVRAFVADTTATQQKRAAVIDRLIASEEFIEFWTNKWADLLQVNRKFLGPAGSLAYRDWIRQSIAENKPYDAFVREILTASGSNQANPPASYFKVLREPDEMMENTTHLFLGIRFNCNKCHDHPFERWTQDQYYETAAYFARTSLRRDPESGKETIGGTAVEGAKPLYEEVYEADQGEIKHERTGQEVAPVFPFEVPHDAPQSGSRRDQLAAWLTDVNNPYFARSYVNRLWAYLLGIGLIDPIDDIRAGNPPTNPELLDHLSESFVESGFDVRQLMRNICNSRTYQLSIAPNPWNEDDSLNYARAMPRRLPAEVLFDAIHYVTGSRTQIPGVPKGTRAAALPDVGIATEDGFLQNLGQPVRESACECERSNELQLGPVMALVSGPTVGQAIADSDNDLVRLVERFSGDAELVEELFLRVLGRRPSDAETETFADFRAFIADDHKSLSKTLSRREATWKEELDKREATRTAALAKAEEQLVAQIEELRPEVERLEAVRTERIADAESKLAATRKAKYEQWSQHSADEDGVEWFPMVPVEMKASNGDQLRGLEDRSIIVTGKADKGVYELSFETSLTNITGLRVEALTDDSLKGKGPGLAANGNFVLTDFEVVSAPRKTPKQQSPVALSRAIADFSQEGFDPAQAINGSQRDQQGWAVSGAVGQPHWIVFQAKEPIAAGSEHRITIRMHQFHNAVEHRLGRFRISATTAADETLPLGLAEPLRVVLRTPAEDRSEAQTTLLTSYFESVDKDIKADLAVLTAAQAAVPKDPKVVAIQQRIARLKAPTPTPQELERLRVDFEHSQRQLAEERLTAAEDLTWALINSPAFLFNR